METSKALMSPPGRRQLPDRRPAIAEKFPFVPERGEEPRSIYIRVGFHPTDGAPLEIFLRPSKRAARQGSVLHRYAEDIGEMLSLLLQHGHTLEQLAARFKVGTLALFAVRAALKIASEENCQLAPKSVS